MPTYLFENMRTGEIVELVKTVADRDNVPSHLKRIAVPQTVGYANNPSLREPGADVDVPRAFRQLEESGRSAGDIARKTGFSVDHIKRTWGMMIMALCLLSFTARAADITTGYSFTTTEHVTASKMNAIAGSAVINPEFITGKSVVQPVSADSFILSQSGNLKRTTLDLLFLSNTNLIVGATEDTAPQTNDFLLTLDVSANTFKKSTLVNLMQPAFLNTLVTNAGILTSLITTQSYYWASTNFFTYQTNIAHTPGGDAGTKSTTNFYVPHGLALSTNLGHRVVPTWVRTVLVCTNAGSEVTFHAGDEIDAANLIDNQGNPAFLTWVNSTNVGVMTGPSSIKYKVPGATPAGLNLEENWNIKVYVRP